MILELVILEIVGKYLLFWLMDGIEVELKQKKNIIWMRSGSIGSNQLDASFSSIENIHRISVNNPLKRYSLKTFITLYKLWLN